MIKDEEKILELMNDIDYGWIDKSGQLHYNVDETFSDTYILQTPEEVIRNKIGVCWDQVELERYYFEKMHKSVKTFFLVHYDNDRCPTHTFLTFEKDGKYYWFEHSWEKFRGIHEYETMGEMLLSIRDKFIASELYGKYEKENLVLHEYDLPKFHSSVQEFYNHCDYGKFIDFDALEESLRDFDIKKD